MLISVADARLLCRRVFAETLGASEAAVLAATDVLVDADLRGISSHGILVLPYYVDKWRQGQIVAAAEPEVLSSTVTTTRYDAHQAIGHHASRLAMESAIDRARESGLGAAVVGNSTHNGAISYYAIAAARAGLIGIAATACAPHVAPHGGRVGLHGTNPISYALPRDGHDPVVFDLSTGYSSAKIKDTLDEDGRIAAGQALDADGEPTTDPADLADGWILPVAGHVGFGLGLLVDGLAAALSDNPIAREVPLVHETDGPYYGSFFCLAISPDAFAGAEAFSSRIESLVGQIESAPPRDPDRPVRWPGQRGWKLARQRAIGGIPFTAERIRGLVAELAELGVEGIEDCGLRFED